MSHLTRIFTALTAGISASNAAEALVTGATLPDLSAKNQDGKTVNLPKAGASGYLLVYFYPKADTPGCTKQACSLRDSFAALTENKVTVFGVSTDSVAAQKAFHEKFKLPFDLLADQDGTLSTALGVPRTMGFAKRQAFLFKDGKLVWRDLTASTSQQAADVLDVIADTPP